LCKSLCRACYMWTLYVAHNKCAYSHTEAAHSEALCRVNWIHPP
jgi:hypothetical protein